MLPKNELVVVRTLPATLASIAAVGTQVTSDRPVAVLTSGPLVAHASVAAGVVGRIRPGMDAQLISGGGPLVRARVVAAARGTAEAAGDLRDVTLRATNGSIPPSWRGRTVLARIITTLVQRRGLLVPTRAVSQDADGNAYVLKRTGSEAFARVRVTPLGSLAGRTAVKPVVA